MRIVGSGSTHGASEMLDVLDRVLDRGIVIDAEMNVSLIGLNLAGVEARIVVASIETYLEYVDDITGIAPASWSRDDREESPREPPDPTPDVNNRVAPHLDGPEGPSDPDTWRPE